jgi:hypothetical protein
MHAPWHGHGALLFVRARISSKPAILKKNFRDTSAASGDSVGTFAPEPEVRMRFLILSLAVLLSLAALTFLVGWVLPATRQGSAEAVIAAPPDRILAVISDVEAQPEWRAVRTVTRTAEGWEEVTLRGERIAFVAEELNERRIRLRFASDAGYFGEWEAMLEPAEGGTRIKVVERATVKSPIGRIVSRLMFDPDAFSTMYLAALKTRVEG